MSDASGFGTPKPPRYRIDYDRVDRRWWVYDTFAQERVWGQGHADKAPAERAVHQHNVAYVAGACGARTVGEGEGAATPIAGTG